MNAAVGVFLGAGFGGGGLWLGLLGKGRRCLGHRTPG